MVMRKAKDALNILTEQKQIELIKNTLYKGGRTR